MIGAVLDRNGLRPSRYYVTTDGMVVMASEVGVLDIPAEKILMKERLHPGRIFLVDTAKGRIVDDEEIKAQLAAEHPYADWLRDNLVHLEELRAHEVPAPDHATVLTRQIAFGYTHEDLRILLGPMAKNGEEPVGSMGTDTSLAVLSNRPRPLYDYFKQLFAQVTNPPLDQIREELVTSMESTVGPERNLLVPEPESCRQIVLKDPVITNEELAKLAHVAERGFKALTLPMLYSVAEGAAGLERTLELLQRRASAAIAEGYNVIILSDRGISKKTAAIPSLLATASMHHHLVRRGERTRCGLVIETGDAREVHHLCLLIGYGAGAVNPWVAFETIDDMISEGLLPGVDRGKAIKNYIKALNKGILKVMAKMGISTLQSYTGAQIFEAIGLHGDLVHRYFTGTVSRVSGIGLDVIADEVRRRHERAFPERPMGAELDWGGEYQWRRDGEHHMVNPDMIAKLQHATRSGSYAQFKDFTRLCDDQSKRLSTLRGLIELRPAARAVPIEEVEPIESIFKRFATGAMSYGSISQEAHETLAIAMNRIGGRSNTGEGGEDAARYRRDANGDWRRSAVKQVASGRFGVTSEYLVNATDLQIKMAQGAKPGEGGQLPGGKVYPWIAKVRFATPGVQLISPPPHHDIYSIEDIKQLIHDLKNANPEARVHVKLVAEIGVGTVAAGVAKAFSDVVLISGHDGGTGASPLTSIKHGGVPWELGLAETQQVLVLNKLRDRIVVQVDGQMKTGRDVVIAALLGGEEYGFSTAPLVVLGCIMMRVCHLNTCPVGIATQDPELRKRFAGQADYVVNFFRFLAQEVREHMASLGFRTMDEMIGRVDRLDFKPALEHWKACGLDLSSILYQPDVPPDVARRRVRAQDHALESSLDSTTIVPACREAVEHKKPVELHLPIRNVNRTVGTTLGYHITKRWGGEGLPDDTIRVHFTGSAGQSFGAFVPRGVTFTLEGDANDYWGKGLSGGKLTVFPPRASTFVPEDNIIIGNVALYGATSGEAYVRGVAGERFCVRNSGAHAVVEGVGDHACEYMTGGRVVVLGQTGRNFAAGMSGGIAYVLDLAGDFKRRCNLGMVDLERLDQPDEIGLVRDLIRASRRVHRIGLRRGHPARLDRHAAALREDHAAGLQARAPRGGPGAGRGARADLRGARRDAPVGKVTGFLEIKRKKAPARPVAERVHDWKEYYLPYPVDELTKQAARCMDCGIPFCHQGCPLGNIIPDWNDLVYKDQWREAIDRLHATNNFPEWTGRLCPAPCEGACVLGINDDPVTIKGVEVCDHRARVRRGMGRRRPAGRPHRQAGGGRRLRPGRPRRRRAAQPCRSPGDRLRARRSHRRPPALRHSRVQDGEALRRPPARPHGEGWRALPDGRARRGQRAGREPAPGVRRGGAGGRGLLAARSHDSRARARRRALRDGVPDAPEPAVRGRPRPGRGVHQRRG